GGAAGAPGFRRRAERRTRQRSLGYPSAATVDALFERRLCRRHARGRFGRGAEPPSEEAHRSAPFRISPSSCVSVSLVTTRSQRACRGFVCWASACVVNATTGGRGAAPSTARNRASNSQPGALGSLRRKNVDRGARGVSTYREGGANLRGSPHIATVS